MNKVKKIAIIGGGISGLSLAYQLQKRFGQNPLVQIDLFEKKDRLGGVIETKTTNGFVIEKGPDGFLQQKPTVPNLAKDLGIDQELISTKLENRRSLILQNNRLVEVPDGFYLMSPSKIIPFLKSPLLSWKGKFRTLVEPLIPAKKDNAEESLSDFVRRRFGQENLEKISQAMLGGIHTADPDKLSMQSALPRFSKMEQEHGSVMVAIMKNMARQANISGARYGLFGSFRNGMSTLVEALSKKIPASSLHLGSQIQSVAFQSLQRTWTFAWDGKKEDFDIVCFAIPPHAIAHLLPQLNPVEKSTLQSIPYASSAVFHFAFRHQQINNLPPAVGFIVPHREQKHFIACSFISHKYDFRAPDGITLLRVFAGGALQEDLLKMPENALCNMILDELKAILNIQGNPVMQDMQFWPKSMPQYTLGHQSRAEKIHQIFQSMPNGYLLGNAYQGIGTPDLIEQSQHLAQQINL